VWFAHWLPPPVATRRYSTFFFFADAHLGDVTVDDGEIRDHRWITPGEALSLHAERQIALLTPTWMTLSRFAGFSDVATALATLRVAAPELRITKMATDTPADAIRIALWAGDAGYATGDATLPGPRHRLVMPHTGAWHAERYS